MVKYCITDPSFYHDIDSFTQYIENIYRKNPPDFIRFRDKINKDLSQYIDIFLQICKKYNVTKTFLNSQIDERFYGVHLTSKQFDKIKTAKQKGLFTIISTHSKEEIERAYQLGADAVTYSPIFFSPNKGKPKGLDNLKEVIKLFPTMKIIALGGIISQKQISQIKNTKAFGFASIRYFQ